MEKEQLQEKLDRELIELLNELRVALPGVQVLFAFLLIVPFSEEFGGVGDSQRTAYTVSLFATLLGTILLIAPTAHHRLRWRAADKEWMLNVANRLAIAGLACVAVAMTAAVYLVADIVLDTTAAAVAAVGAALGFTAAWFVLPLIRSYDRWDERAEGPDEPDA